MVLLLPKDMTPKPKAALQLPYPHYTAFLFSYGASSRAAFDKECENFHDFGRTERLDNVGHPQRPAQTEWLCPRCNFYS